MTSTTSSAPGVSVVLNLRQLRRVPESPDQFLELWAILEQRLHGITVRSGQELVVDLAERGTCTLTTVPPTQDQVVSGDTPFSVVSVIEPSRVQYRCSLCSGAGLTTYGPYICNQCGTETSPGRVCDDHVVILEGNLRASCTLHLPTCSCGRAGQFWCRGRGCNGQVAHCNQHQVSHPNLPGVSYCNSCFADLFPRCTVAGCRSTGMSSCDFRDRGSGKTCSTRLCASHSHRWQVYGPERGGLILCSDHSRRLPTLSHEEIIYQIVAGVVSRAPGRASHEHARPPAGNSGREGVRIPRLSMTRHIFINTRNELLDLPRINLMFNDLQMKIADKGFEGAMRRRLATTAPQRSEEIRKWEQEMRAGRQAFDRLVHILQARGRSDLLPGLEFSDYKPHANALWVRLPETSRPRFIGRQGSEIKALSEALGLKIMLEGR